MAKEFKSDAELFDEALIEARKLPLEELSSLLKDKDLPAYCWWYRRALVIAHLEKA